jgi:hypothetical protein
VKNLIGIIAVGILMSGCALKKNVVLNNIGTTPIDDSYVNNQLDPDSYPGFMAGQGNIYSCRYGIAFITRKEFTPPKEQMFAFLLKQNIPNIDKHKVTLEQFDVYYNQRLKSLSGAGTAMGGIVGQMIASSANNSNFGFTYNNLLVDIIPDTYPIETTENAVGCDNANEGEYYPSRVTAGHDVVVTWLKFQIDDESYHFRTLYQVQPEGLDEIDEAISTAIIESMKAVTQQIRI